MKRKVCVVTGSRAEYGLLKWVMEGLQASDALDLQLVVTGSHLVAEFGLTYQEIERDGFRIDRKVDVLLAADTGVAVAKSMGLGMIGFADAYRDLAPDLLLVLGDRFEMLAAVSAALVTRIPVAHVHGGEKTEGAIDDAIRHAITKMSHLHFVAANEYRERVIQLGEAPDRVFCVGGLGVDAIHRVQLLDRQTLEKATEFSFGARNLMVTFHPETLGKVSALDQVSALLNALDRFPDIRVIFTYPNADMDGQSITRLIENYVTTHPASRAYKSLGQLNYLSCLQYVDAVVGNSSSGLLEAPSFNKGTINIGQRQAGRLRAESIIDCDANEESIVAAINRLYSPVFQSMLAGVNNPYGNGGAADAIVAALESADFGCLLHKSFLDVRN